MRGTCVDIDYIKVIFKLFKRVFNCSSDIILKLLTMLSLIVSSVKDKVLVKLNITTCLGKNLKVLNIG